MTDDGIMEVDPPKKEMTLETWRKKCKKMNVSYDSISNLQDDANKKLGADNYYITTVPKIKIIIVYPFAVVEGGKDDDRIHLSRDALFYFLTEKGTHKKMNTEKFINALVEKLTPHVSVEELVRDALYDTNPEDLKEMYERVVEKKGSIKEKPGCYKLRLGGKRGVPFEFMLRD
jgi:hypothetical protein